MAFHLLFWGVVNHLLLVVVLLLVQPRLKRSTNFRILNEFLCSFALAVWSLELGAIVYVSTVFGRFVLFVRMLFAPYITEGAFLNPAQASYHYLQKGPGRRNMLQLFAYTVVEVAAGIAGILFCMLSWNVLGSVISDDHLEYMKTDMGHVLQVSPLQGFIIELVLTFLCYLPGLFIKPSFLLYLVVSSFITFFVHVFAHTTGAFLNPLTAITFVLMWERHDLYGYAIHFVVYWLGPLLGTAVFLVMEPHLQRSKVKI